MNEQTSDFFWNVLVTGLIRPIEINTDEQRTQLLSEEISLPEKYENCFNIYFDTNDEEHLVRVAIDSAKSFSLVRERPEEHLILVAFLLKKRLITAEDAASLSQIEPSHFRRMSKQAMDLVRLAEVVAEEQRMGIRAANSDNFLQSSLFEFSRLKGFNF